MTEFEVDTRVEPVAPQEYAASVSDRWHVPGSGPNGGYLLALCLQALRRDMPLPDPLVVSAFFLRPGQVGPVSLHTELVRAGRRTASGEVEMRQAGRPALRATATFTDLDKAEGETLLIGHAPALPEPELCVDPVPGGSLPRSGVIERVEYRFAEPPGWLRGNPGHELSTQFWMRLRDGGEADPVAVAMLVDAAPPPVHDLGVSGSTTLELTVHVRARPVPGWLACRSSTRHVVDGFHEEDFEIWDSEGRLVAQSRQIALLPQQR